MSTIISQIVDYRARLEEFQAIAAAEYGIGYQETEIIAAALLPAASGYNPAWLICDAAHHPFWTGLKCIQEVQNIAVLRAIRPRYANQTVEKILETRAKPQILLDPDHANSTPQRFLTRALYPRLERECLRLRVDTTWLSQPGIRGEERLSRAIQSVLNIEHRQVSPTAITPPELLKLAVDIVHRLNPAIDPGAALRSACSFTAAHAVLVGRERVTEEDHRLTYRVLRDTVRSWTTAIIRHFAENHGYHSIDDLVMGTGLARGVVIAECGRLASVGVVYWPKPKRGGSGSRPKWIKMKSGMGEDVGRFVMGEMEW